MSTIEERVAYLEGQVSELSHGLVSARDAVRDVEQRLQHLELRIDARFEAVDRRFDAIDGRFDAIDRRFEAIDRRFEVMDRRFETMDRRFEALESRLSNQFMWVVGVQITSAVSIVATLIART